MTDVTVVVLNYNYARFLPTAITSALGQTHDSVEVVVVDDGSTDDSLAVIESFGDDVIAVLHEDNRGQGAAINSGAAVANGELVWFLDADDALLETACATAVDAVRADPGIAKFHTALAIIDGDGRATGQTLPAQPHLLAAGDIAEHVFRHRAHSWPPMSGNAYAMSALSQVLPVPAETYRQAADSFLNEQVAVCGPIARCTEPVAAYRRHGGNQFAGQPVSLEWLRTKIGRETASHQQLGRLAERLGLDGHRPHHNDVQDVAFFGYRLASLRLDPAGHPVVDQRRADSRFGLAVAGIRAALANRHVAPTDRLLRSLWFVAAAAAPTRAVVPLLSAYMPDGPSEPVWRRRRRPRLSPIDDERGPVLVPTATAVTPTSVTVRHRRADTPSPGGA